MEQAARIERALAAWLAAILPLDEACWWCAEQDSNLRLPGCRPGAFAAWRSARGGRGVDSNPHTAHRRSSVFRTDALPFRLPFHFGDNPCARSLCYTRMEPRSENISMKPRGARRIGPSAGNRTRLFRLMRPAHDRRASLEWCERRDSNPQCDRALSGYGRVPIPTRRRSRGSRPWSRTRRNAGNNRAFNR